MEIGELHPLLLSTKRTDYSKKNDGVNNVIVECPPSGGGKEDDKLEEEEKDSHNTTTHNQNDDNDNDNQDQAATTAIISWWVYILAGCAVLNTFNVGFDIGVNSPAGYLIQQDLHLSDGQLEWFMGILNFGSMLGAMANAWLVQRYGMRASFLLSSCLFFVGTLLVVGTNLNNNNNSTTLTMTNPNTNTTIHFGMLFLGRSLVGLGNGFGCTVTPQYISEISPAVHRGFLTSWSETACNVGILLGFAMGYVFANVSVHSSWRYMLAMGCIVPIVMMFVSCFVLVESPRWLIQQERFSPAAAVLKQLFPQTSEPGRQAMMREIQNDDDLSSSSSWKSFGISLLRNNDIRTMVGLGVGIAVAHELSGIDAIQYYLIFIFQAAGITSRHDQGLYLLTLGCLKLMTLFVASAVVDRLGRRPLLLLSLSGMILSLVVVAATFVVPVSLSSASSSSSSSSGEEEQDPNEIKPKTTEEPLPLFGVTLAGLGSFLLFFSLGLGPLGWLLPPELYSTAIRSHAVSLSTLANRLTATVMTSTMLSLAHWLTWWGYFVGLAAVNAGIALWVWWYLPETKGVSLEQVGTLYRNQS